MADAEAAQLRASNSEIQAFKRCRRKWWLGYYRGLAPRRESKAGPRAIGTRVHQCVALYYDAQVVEVTVGGAAVDPVTAALAHHDWLVTEDLARCGDELESASIAKEADLSRAMLEGYFEWLEETGADEGMRVVAAEQSVEREVLVPVAGHKGISTPVTLMGKLDLRVERDGLDSFLDHKTVATFTAPIKTLHLDEQMLLYHWLRDQGARPGGAIYNMLRKVKRSARAKPPFFERFEVRHSEAEVQSFMRRTLKTLGEMVRLRAELEGSPGDASWLAYPSPRRECSWDCDFFAVCPLVDRQDLGGGEGLIETLYQKGDPYARYQETGDAAQAPG